MYFKYTPQYCTSNTDCSIPVPGSGMLATVHSDSGTGVAVCSEFLNKTEVYCDRSVVIL